VHIRDSGNGTLGASVVSFLQSNVRIDSQRQTNYTVGTWLRCDATYLCSKVRRVPIREVCLPSHGVEHRDGETDEVAGCST
jgi:hypothetical protein